MVSILGGYPPPSLKDGGGGIFIWTKTPWFSNPKVDVVEISFILEILNQ